MRKLVLKINMTLDGFVAGPNGEGDWLFTGSNDESKAWLARTLYEPGTHIVGANSFVGMTKFYPTSTLPFAPPMNEIPKVVFSRSGKTKELDDAMKSTPPTPAGASWREARIATGDLRDEIAKLKAEPGKDILAQAGAKFARALVAAGLVDEFRLVVCPIAIGKGQPLFSDLPKPLLLETVETITFATGLMVRVLRPSSAS